MNDMQLRRKKEQRHGNQEERWLEGAESALTLHKCIPGIESGRFGRYCMGQPSQNKRRNTCISVPSLAYSMGNPSLAWRRDRANNHFTGKRQWTLFPNAAHLYPLPLL